LPEPGFPSIPQEEAWALSRLREEYAISEDTNEVLTRKIGQLEAAAVRASTEASRTINKQQYEIGNFLYSPKLGCMRCVVAEECWYQLSLLYKGFVS